MIWTLPINRSRLDLYKAGSEQVLQSSTFSNDRSIYYVNYDIGSVVLQYKYYIGFVNKFLPIILDEDVKCY